ncbi:MAG TPA: hypothetical protein VGH01_08825 [Jatrophihabitantaceae bacterium]|jgi:hypothetical protein|nr:hypothetical protein [Acetobacteraceae bacterium]
MTGAPVCVNHIDRFDSARSIEMYTMYEALARDRMRATGEFARQRRIARELAAARRWHRLELHARAAEQRARSARRRHALRAH